MIGYPALASTSAEQGRQAIRHAFNVPGPRGRTEILPFAIYAIPEVSFIGETEEGPAAPGRGLRRGPRPVRDEPPGADSRRHRRRPEAALRDRLPPPAGRARDRNRRQRAGAHRPGISAECGGRLADGRDHVQLSHPVRSVPPRGVEGHRRPAAEARTQHRGGFAPRRERLGPATSNRGVRRPGPLKHPSPARREGGIAHPTDLRRRLAALETSQGLIAVLRGRDATRLDV
ncbi:MAG: hypothetical protein M0C28_22900 [Candidatus Moduliflexus flocculans]|nr:hypothetical protein [Candidatus Moduliflexus flocculans]